MRHFLTAASAALLCALTANSLSAAEYRLLSLKGSLVKWGAPTLGTPGVVTYALADRNLSFKKARNCKGITSLHALLERYGVSHDVFKNELNYAFSAWERAAKIRFKRVTDLARAGIVIGAQVKPRGRAYTNVDTHATSGGSGQVTSIRKSLICLNPAHGWKVGFGGNAKNYDLRYTLIHEIGHAIGLDHSGPEGQVMGFRYTEHYRAPQAGDIRGAALLYGAAGSTSLASMNAYNQESGPTGLTSTANQPETNLSLGEKAIPTN